MMKLRGSKLLAPILVFVSFVTTGFLLEQSSNPAIETTSTWLSAAVDKSKNLFINRDSANGAATYAEASLQFEPLLLFVLGTVLLSVVTCINLVRTRRLNPHFNSAGQSPANAKMHPAPRKREPEK